MEDAFRRPSAVVREPGIFLPYVNRVGQVAELSAGLARKPLVDRIVAWAPLRWIELRFCDHDRL